MSKVSLLGGVFAASLAVPAFSMPVISVESVSGAWSGATGGTKVTYIDDAREVRWGAGDPQSGYRFDGAAPASFEVDLNQEFDLGEFTHFNYSIGLNTGVDSVFLNISMNISIEGAPYETPLAFTFLHKETRNVGEDCCDDVVSFENLVSSESFEVDGRLYTLDLKGFGKEGEPTVEELKTIEGTASSAKLRGVFTRVPEPGTLALFGLGLAGLGLSRCRRS